MSITLDLPQELESKLVSEATRLGLSVTEYALNILATGDRKMAIPKTGAALVAYWQSEGLLGTRPDITNSQEHARHLRNQAEQRS